MAIASCPTCTSDSVTVLRGHAVAVGGGVLGSSCEVQLAKPDPAIYLAVVDTLGIKAHECLFVGDGADGELRGAEAVGMRAIQICEFADSDPTWDGPTIAKLPELLDHV